WDSNTLRVPTLAEVDRHAQEFVKKYPRSSLDELKAVPVSDPDAFRKWAKESHQVAVDWAYDLTTLPDPNKDQPAEKLVQNMVNFILNGVSPVKDAPELPAGYWERLQSTVERRLTLAGYRIADLLISATEQIEAQRKFVGR
ncbi:S1/P1 nuclease, partial [Petrachloros mirabilis]